MFYFMSVYIEVILDTHTNQTYTHKTVLDYLQNYKQSI